MARSEVRGVRRTTQAIRSLGRGFGVGEVRRAHQQALEPMQSEARAQFMANGSFKTGVIPDDIQIIHTGPAETKLGMTGMGASLGHIIELGSLPHFQPQRGSWHPGAEPKSFMRPAYDSTSQISLMAAAGVYSREFDRIARVLRSRT